MKTALSITLTDRLKRGFNSCSSPWALHHLCRYPSTPLLSPFIVSPCQSLGGLAKWPLLLLRSSPVFSLILWLWVREVQQWQQKPYHWTEMLAVCCSQGYRPYIPHTGHLMAFLWKGLTQSHLCTSFSSHAHVCLSRLSFPHVSGLVNPHYYPHFYGF